MAEPRKLWDSSNIAESYSGVTLPLTASFARHIYAVVYREVARTSGVPPAIIARERQVFDNLLGFFHGRFYYNLYSWYRLLSCFPAFGFTQRSMEQMMGVPDSAAFTDTVQMPRGFTVRYLARAVRRYLTFGVELTRFRRNFAATWRELSARDLGALSSIDLLEVFHAVEVKVLPTWHTPVDNDFLVMVYCGLLHRLAARWRLEREGRSVVNDLLSAMSGVVGTEQARQLMAIAALVRAEDRLRQRFSREPATEVFAQLRGGAFGPTLRDLVAQYLERFGDRFINELKLEEGGMAENPARLISLINLYVGLPERSVDTRVAEAERVRRAAEASVHQHLNVGQRAVFGFVLKQARRHLRVREEFRLNRAQIFGFVRRLFARLGEALHAEGALRTPADIFYLEIDEVERYVNGTATTGELPALVSLRQAEAAAWRAAPLPRRFSTTGIPYRHLPVGTPPPAPSATPRAFRGLPCSPGRARGRIVVMREPHAAIPREAEILVAVHTDPGWTPLFPRFAGVIVEHGGLLSHAAIVSRELGIPCVVGIAGLTQQLPDGARVRMDGRTGEVTMESNAAT